jgi:hypothetical protein
MNVLLAHVFRRVSIYGMELGGHEMGWLEGKLTQVGDRWDILNKAGNKLVQGATTGFIATLRNKGLLKEDDRC